MIFTKTRRSGLCAFYASLWPNSQYLGTAPIASHLAEKTPCLTPCKHKKARTYEDPSLWLKTRETLRRFSRRNLLLEFRHNFVQVILRTSPRPLLLLLHNGLDQNAIYLILDPWYQNITKSLRKEPKWFLRDWSGIENQGKRAETFIACHLLKAVDLWTDLGIGNFELRYLRDKQKREVDFVVIRDNEPWCLVEVKNSDRTLSPALSYFQQQTRAPHAFQVVMDMPFVNVDCFTQNTPTVVPARTLLSQLP